MKIITAENDSEVMNITGVKDEQDSPVTCLATTNVCLTMLNRVIIIIYVITCLPFFFAFIQSLDD